MHPVSGISTQITQANTSQKADSKPNTAGVSFGSVFDAVKRSLDGIMVVADGGKAMDAEMRKEKLDIEKGRKFKTDLEQAHEILEKITRLMEEHGKTSK